MKASAEISSTPSQQTNINTALILAGGLGTRLREAVPDLPKCMASVAGRPFLFHVINYLRSEGIEKFIFSLGYKHEIVENWLAEQFASLDYQVVIEAEPLGTGGAIKLACSKTNEKNIIVTNGDTLFKADINALSKLHNESGAECSLVLKPMKNFDRYGVVEMDSNSFVLQFKEKQVYENGLINGGLYALDVNRFNERQFPEKFSFEKEYLELQAGKGTIAAVVNDGYFIDIGIPEDFTRAQTELQPAALDLKKIDKTWTLFLDRDGVINEDKPGSYIFTPDEFIFMHGAPGIFKKLSSLFGRIIVATNQRGVGRGLMTEETLTAIHKKMQDQIEQAGGKLDAIYYAMDIENKASYRKPNPGMAVRARKDFSAINPERCIMIGNNLSDMEFGKNAGMYTIFLTTTNQEVSLPHRDIDLIFPTLEDFVKAL